MKHSKALAAIPVVEHRTHQNPLALTAAVVVHEDDLPSLSQLAKLRLGREPVLVAWGGGRDSTAMIIELLARGEPIDVVLIADTGAEKPDTYVFIQLFMQWLRARNIRCVIVRNRTQRFKHWPRYTTIVEDCLTNGGVPSLATGRHSCSLKWKVEPQNRWTQAWPLAQEAWAAGCRVVKLIGYDCSPADSRRYAEHEGHEDPKRRYRLRYPLREWGWTLEDCIACIERAGLPVPPKSSCFFCPAMKPWEVDALEKPLLRRIVLVEANAQPFLTEIQGLWGRGTKGTRGGIRRPGTMTQYIREQGLLDAEEIDRLMALAPRVRVLRKTIQAGVAPEWRALIAALRDEALHVEHTPDLFAHVSMDGEGVSPTPNDASAASPEQLSWLQ